MDRQQLREICEALPIFPLPRTVLLPGAVLSLHVFEHRYRALVEHCLAADRVMGVATLRPGYEADYHGKPEIWPEMGVGEVVSHQPFPDGRCNIVLHSVGRVRVREELPTEHPFRVVRTEVSEDDDRGLSAALAALRVLVLQLGGLSPAAATEARRLVQLEGMDLVDALARRLLEEPDDKRAYLGADRLVDRVELIQDRLAGFFVPTAQAGES